MRCTLTRRSAIARTLAATMSTLLPRTASAAGDGLAAAAASGGRFYGCAVRIDQLRSEPDLRQAVLEESLFLVPEIELEWAAVEPVEGTLSFGGLDDLMTFAAQNGKKVRGHTLLWHLGVPEWANSKLRARPDWQLIARYFGSVIPRYGDVIKQWVVVNEPIDTGHRMDGLRENIFLEAFGGGYIARALNEARLFTPSGQLMINEYGLEYDLAVERDRRYLLLKLLERLKAAGTPLDALGLQAHLDLRKGSVSQSSIASFLKEVAALELAIVVTELDVKEADYTATPSKRDRLVADEVRRYLEVVLDQRAVSGVVTWGLSDRHSWLRVTKDDYARFPGAWKNGDGPGLNRGLPLDTMMGRKPMYFAIKDQLTSR